MDEDNSGEGSASRRGFAAMDPEKQKKIASLGGSKSGGNFKNDRKKAAEAGRRGGQARRRPSTV